MGATAAVVLLAVVGTTPNAGAGPHPERCALLRARVERGFLHQMGACRERETRRGVVDARCFAKVRDKFDDAAGKASMHAWCRICPGTSEWWQPPTPRCSDAPSGFAGLCWP